MNEKAERNKRIVIVVSVLIIHLIIATNIRFIAHENNWNWITQIVLGSIPSLYSVIGLTSLANLFEKKRKAQMPFIVGLASLLYEVTGDFGRTSGSGTVVDYYDISAILIGVLLAYLIEKWFREKSISFE